MKALTILQPWAHAIVWGPKRVENRRWYTGYRGPLAIHAGKDRGEMGGDSPYDALRMIGCKDGDTVFQRPLLFGHVIGRCELVNCVAMPHDLDVINPHVRPWFEGAALMWAGGPYCLLLKDVRPIEPAIPCRGQRGLWELDEELLHQNGAK